MSQPTTGILFTKTTPPANPGYQNVTPTSDNGTPQQSVTFEVPNTGGAVVKTANYTSTIADMGVLLVFNSSSAVTLTLPSSIPLNDLPTPTTETRWNIRVQNIGAGVLTVNRNGLLIDTVAANLTLNQGQGTRISTEGTNYLTEPRTGGGATFGTDLAAIDSTHQKVIGLNTTPLDTSVTLTDGMTLQYNASSGKWVPVFDRGTRPVSAVVGKPGAAQLVLIYTVEATENFPANFASPNSYGSVGTNPTSTAVYTVLKNGTSVGTISISTSGVFTFATASGAAFSLNAGDRLTMTAPATQDATLADVGITLVGTRGSVSSAVAPPPVPTWRGVYSGSTAYSPYDEVSFSGSSYICIATTTGNDPTHTSFWDILAAAGTSGTNGQMLYVDAQNQTQTYCADTSGSANTITIAPATAATSYGSGGQRWSIKVANAVTGATVLNVSGLGNKNVKKWSGGALVALAPGDVSAAQMLDVEYDGTQFVAMSLGSNGGGGSSFPFTVVQERLGNSGGSNTGSYTFTFQQAVAASGNTMFLLIACDGSSTVTIPSGWTSDINKQQGSFARFILCHKATAGETSATITVGSASSFAVYFFEVIGSHSLDQSATGGSGNVNIVSPPAITPTANSVVFAMVAVVTSAGGSPIEGLALAQYNTIGASASAAGGRALMGVISRQAATHVSTTPPAIGFPSLSLFSGGGVAYATFSIL